MKTIYASRARIKYHHVFMMSCFEVVAKRCRIHQTNLLSKAIQLFCVIKPRREQNNCKRIFVGNLCELSNVKHISFAIEVEF